MLLETGTLDEWLSQWSAKPCTAVRIRQVPQMGFNDEAHFLFSAHVLRSEPPFINCVMADNYLEKKMEQHRASSGYAVSKQKVSLAALLAKNRSMRVYDSSYIVRADQLRRIVSVNDKLASARNRQVLRFRIVASDEAVKVLPFVTMGSAIKDVALPMPGCEPNAFIVVCSCIEPRPSTYVDLGISVQSMLLQAVEIGLNGICLMSFEKDRIVENLLLPYEPLAVLAIGKAAERVEIVDIKENEDHTYYRRNGVHYVPKVVVDDLIIG